MKVEIESLRKDKSTGVRVNSEVYEVLLDQGFTAQQIIDEWIKDKVEIDMNPTTKEILFKLK